MKLYLVAGEASGDARGAELIRSLRARRDGIEICGASAGRRWRRWREPVPFTTGSHGPA